MPSANVTSAKVTKLKYTFKSDVLFKLLFVKYPHLLKRLVAVLLGIPIESIEHFETINTEIPPEEIGKKFCRLDINMIIDGKRVNLEIQVEDEGNYPERSIFHWARDFSSALPAGEDYSLLPRTIIISILGFKLFPCEEMHSEYRPLEITRHTPLTDKMRLLYFELPKLPGIDLIDPNNEKDLWLALFNAETEEEMAIIERLGVPVMNQAVEAYRSVSATDEFKYLEQLRAKARHDEAQALRNAEKIEREKWQSVVADKDAAIADKDAAIADKDAIIAELRAKLGET